MHDLTGQSLSMITLKSELAAKRLSKLPPSAELDTVLGDLGDIGRVSRQTLHDIREAVSGYRRPTLAIEAITARNALEAAGIRLDDDPGIASEFQDDLLLPGLGLQHPAHSSTAGETQQSEARIDGQAFGDGVITRHHIQPTRRDPRFQSNFAEE